MHFAPVVIQRPVSFPDSFRKKHDRELPAEAKAGVSCDVCHQISRLTGAEGPWGEPGNASFTLTAGRVKYAHSGLFQKNRAHSGEQRTFFAKAEYCASCHTVIHPINGLRIESTYERVESEHIRPEGHSVPGLPHAERGRNEKGGPRHFNPW